MGLTANVIPVNGINRSSQIVTSIVPAGGYLPIFQAGARFYLIVATGVLSIKPNNGSENDYVQGTGLSPEETNQFASITLRNKTAKAIVFQIFVGFGNYIDNRLIVYDPSVIQAPHSVCSIPASLNQINIPDLSNTAFTGENGEKFLALNRIGVYVSNVDNGNTYNIQNAGLTKNLLAVMPLTSIVYPVTGDLAMKIPSGNINAIVSELYNVILAQ